MPTNLGVSERYVGIGITDQCWALRSLDLANQSIRELSDNKGMLPFVGFTQGDAP
jgi:hypothetical protein